MPQGSLKGKKVKTLDNIKKKSSKQKTSGRKHKPITPRKSKHEEAQKLKKIITKNVNRSIEEQMRAVATDGQKVRLSKKKTDLATSNKMPQKTV